MRKGGWQRMVKAVCGGSREFPVGKSRLRQYQIKKQLFLDGAKDKQVVFTSDDAGASHQKRRTATPYLPCYFAD